MLKIHRIPDSASICEVICGERSGFDAISEAYFLKYGVMPSTVSPDGIPFPIRSDSGMALMDFVSYVCLG